MDDRPAAALAWALGDSLRLCFVRALENGRILSPGEFAKARAESTANVRYHVRVLADAGIIEVAETVARRGALEKRYSLTGPRAGVALAVVSLLSEA